MSAPLASKFQDHYAILEIDPKSDSEAIQRAYSKLAQKYHPNNSATGSGSQSSSLNVWTVTQAARALGRYATSRRFRQQQVQIFNAKARP